MVIIRVTVRPFHLAFTTQDLKDSFENATGENLAVFFNKWVYGEEIPHLIL
jgi:aminopeptidase N